MMEERSRRSELDIIIEMLFMTLEPQRITNLLYKMNMSYAQLHSYLEKLQDIEYMRILPGRPRYYETTELGSLFLETLQ
jgi:predicted transcriptional regulator